MTTATPTPTSEMARPEIRRTQLLIDGRFRDAEGGRTFQTINPATEEKIADVAHAQPADVDAAVQAARRALETGDWPKMDAADRGRCLYRLADLMEQHLEELAQLETLDNGKPLHDSRTIDLPLVIDIFRYYAGWADKIQGDTVPVRGNYFTYLRREPVGVCGQIIPWNFPLLMLSWKWGPALAAGCTSILKPAEQTPLTALRVGELALEAGFPPGVVNILPGHGDTGQHIVKHPGVDKVAFTGEYKTAQQIMADAAPTLKRLSFELGGKSPNIVFNDADLHAAADGAFIGLYLNQGQCCCAGSRLFVQSDIHDQLVDRLVDMSEKRKLGDPFAPDTEQGPQVDRQQFDKIMHYIERGKAEGATCLTGGGRAGERGYFIQPTVFTDVRDDMAIATDEIFGPVMNILRFDDFDEVVARGNATFYGLAAAVWTRDLAKAHRTAHALKAGTVWVNCFDKFDAAAPFGGHKMSGQGRELGQLALEHYTEPKTITINLDV